MLNLLGIFVAFIFMMYFAFKDMSVVYLSAAAAFIVAAFNGMPLVDTFLNVYLKGAGGYFGTYVAVLLFGAIMGRLYSVSGAAVSIADTIAKAFFKENQTPEKKQRTAILVILLAGGVLAYGGINLIVLVFTLYPLVLDICHKADIPKRFICGLVMGGIATYSMTGPGSPQLPNVVPMDILGTASTSALIPGIVGMIVEIIVMVIVLDKMITKARNNGEHFAYGPKDVVFDETMEKPAFIVSLLPLIIIFVLFNFFSMNLSIALIYGLLAATVLFYKYYKKSETLTSLYNAGIISGSVAIVNISMVIGFGNVVKAAPGFIVLIEALTAMQGNPYVVLAFAVAVACVFGGTASAGNMLVLPVLAPYFTKMGVSAGALHRISAFASSTLDTIPTSATLLMVLAHTDTSLKDGYGPAFATTVFATSIGTAAVVILIALFPALA